MNRLGDVPIPFQWTYKIEDRYAASDAEHRYSRPFAYLVWTGIGRFVGRAVRNGLSA